MGIINNLLIISIFELSKMIKKWLNEPILLIHYCLVLKNY